MAEFGWAYVEGGAITGSGGITGSVQFLVDPNTLSGSENFVFASGSNNLSLSGAMEVTGTSTFNGFAGAETVGNSSTINYNTDTGANYNSLLLGPITIASGASLTIGTNSNVKVKDLEDV
jgi:hypothetical protein|tara:strand:+ start:38 stop:397 length:360 start_codon:yes stop_codon:yes gene_type:complete